MKKLKVGIIGCGRISVLHCRVTAESELAELVACADVELERAEKYAAKYGAKAYADYREMIEKEHLDAVHICLPHYLHARVAIDAMEHGLHVLSEKPMDVDMESAEAAIAASKRTGKLYGVVSQCRYTPSAQLVKAALAAGKLGKVISARSVMTWSRDDAYYADGEWRGTWEMEGGGVMINQAIHSVDLVRWLIDDEVAEVEASMRNRQHATVAVEDTAEGRVTFQNGALYHFYANINYGCDEPIEIRLLCEKGKVILEYDDAVIRYNDGTAEEVHRKQEPTEGKAYWGNMHGVQIHNFHRACLGLDTLEIDGEEALKTHKLICAMYQNGGFKPPSLCK